MRVVISMPRGGPWYVTSVKNALARAYRSTAVEPDQKALP